MADPCRVLTTSLLLGLALAATPTLARADDEWVLLGQREIDFAPERDVVQSSLREGRFDALKLQVLSNGLRIERLVVHYQNGERQELEVREHIAPTQHTRVIQLAGDHARIIDRVAIVADTQGRGGGKATVRVLARRAGPGGAAPETQWVRLGRREVDWKPEGDTIVVTGEEGRFRRICLEVEGNAIDLYDVTVHFGDGEKQDVQVRANIAAGGRTRAIDLDGGSRVINRVHLAHRTDDQRGRRGRATVILLGERAGDAPAPQGNGGGDAAPDDDDRGWELLGQRDVAFGVDRDVIAVGRGEGRFRKLRLRVLGNDVEILDLKVTFGNGSTQDVSVRERIQQGRATRVIDLPGEARAIRSVQVIYANAGRPRDGRATIKLFGKND